jgi:hypothetical protein
MNNKILVLLVFILFACTKTEVVEKPDWLVPEETMVEFLVEMHIIESKMTRLGLRRDSVEQIFDQYQENLFEKYDLVDSVYYKSYNYYLNDLKAMNRIYEAIVDSLNVREQVAKQSNIPPSEQDQKPDN